MNFRSWDDAPNFDKPFAFDAAMYSMDADGTPPAANPHVAQMVPAVQPTPTLDTVSSTRLIASSLSHDQTVLRKAGHNGFLGHQEGFNIPSRRQHRMPQSLSYAEQSLVRRFLYCTLLHRETKRRFRQMPWGYRAGRVPILVARQRHKTSKPDLLRTTIWQ